MTPAELVKREPGEVVSLESCESRIASAIKTAELALERYHREGERAREIGDQSQLEIGSALAEIRDGRLYKATHSSFESYLRERWGYSRPRGYELIKAATVCQSGMADSPQNERQARALLKVPEADRPEVLERAAADGKVTAAKIAAAAEQVAAGEPAGPDVALLAVVQQATRRALAGGWSLHEIHKAVTDAPGGSQ